MSDILFELESVNETVTYLTEGFRFQDNKNLVIMGTVLTFNKIKRFLGSENHKFNPEYINELNTKRFDDMLESCGNDKEELLQLKKQLEFWLSHTNKKNDMDMVRNRIDSEKIQNHNTRVINDHRKVMQSTLDKLNKKLSDI